MGFWEIFLWIWLGGFVAVFVIADKTYMQNHRDGLSVFAATVFSMLWPITVWLVKKSST